MRLRAKSVSRVLIGFLSALAITASYNNCSRAFQSATISQLSTAAATGAGAATGAATSTGSSAPTGAPVNSAYALDIISPQPHLTSASRYYRAYPGLDYNVQIGVVGGAYPYAYSLSGPAGMTVDKKTGVVDWPNPSSSVQPYPVTVTVKDSSGATASVNWDITVTTQGFLFVDAVNGKTAEQGGDGSISNPFQNIADWYVSKNNSANQRDFIYFRNGTYFTNAAPMENGVRLNVNDNTPIVWLAYPGEKPVIDTTGSYVLMCCGLSNPYVEGFTFQNFTTHFGVMISSDSSNVVFRNNIFQNLPLGDGGEGTNASGLFISRGSSPGSNFLIVGNTFAHVHDVGYGILGYYSWNVLIDRNSCSDFTSSDDKCFGPKEGTQRWFIRNNRINMDAGQGIWIDASDTGTYETSDVEVSYNLVQMTTGKAVWIGQANVPFGRITSFRNTYIGGSGTDPLQDGIQIAYMKGGDGPVSFTDDVILNDNPTPVSDPTNLTVTSNLLSGSLSSGIVDSAGNLTGAFAQYVGLEGYQQ